MFSGTKYWYFDCDEDYPGIVIASPKWHGKHDYDETNDAFIDLSNAIEKNKQILFLVIDFNRQAMLRRSSKVYERAEDGFLSIVSIDETLRKRIPADANIPSSVKILGLDEADKNIAWMKLRWSDSRFTIFPQNAVSYFRGIINTLIESKLISPKSP